MSVAFALVLALPLLGAVSSGLLSLLPVRSEGHSRAFAGISALISPLSVFLSFSALLWLIPEAVSGKVSRVVLADWLPLSGVALAWQIDRLSLFFGAIITFIGGLIHMYSAGYLYDRARDIPRYFTYLNLFVFFMLQLVFADNLVLTFLGWEGVGLCSFLLIGFDMHKPAAVAAGRKAFVMNRIGDAGFIIGALLLLAMTDTLNYADLSSRIPAHSNAAGILTTIALAFAIAAAGKSAQLPLTTWLPDAMAGPTPVSALIHAATMVTAGLFLLARLAPVYAASQLASLVVIFSGLLTALYGAVVAMAATDIKKVLAYSTVSQLGLMFVAAGTGAHDAALFHVFTHAFFKALLFLAAGSVIIALHHEQDIRKMGGLGRRLPGTAAVFLIGSLALAGIPGLAGFFSKDAILEKALSFRMGGTLIFSVVLLVSLMTAFYSLRLFFLVFAGRPRSDLAHLHPSTGFMRVTLWILAIGSIAAGYAGLPPVLTHAPQAIMVYLDSAIAGVMKIQSISLLPAEEWLVFGSSVTVSVLGFLFAWTRYRIGGAIPLADGAWRPPVVRLAFRSLYLDAIYQKLIVNSFLRIRQAMAFTENKIILPGWEGLGALISGLGDSLSLKKTPGLPDVLMAVATALVIILLAGGSN